MTTNCLVECLNTSTDVLGEEGVVEGVAVDFEQFFVEFNVVAVTPDGLGPLVDLCTDGKLLEPDLLPTGHRFGELLLESDWEIATLVARSFGIGDVVGKRLVTNMRCVEHLLREDVVVGRVKVLYHVGAHNASFVPIL